MNVTNCTYGLFTFSGQLSATHVASPLAEICNGKDCIFLKQKNILKTLQEKGQFDYNIQNNVYAFCERCIPYIEF